jgi:hypothetical protein
MSERSSSGSEHWLLGAFDRLAVFQVFAGWIIACVLGVAAGAHFFFDVGNYPHQGARTMVGLLFLIMAAVCAGLAVAAPRLSPLVRDRFASYLAQSRRGPRA